MLRTLLHHPRKLWLRRALFQIHLWLGVLLSLYIAVIGLSGSTLVFQDEIRRASMRDAVYDEAHVASLSMVLEQAHKSSPSQRLTFVSPPSEESPQWRLYLQDAQGHSNISYADAATAASVKQRRMLIDWVLDLHVYLLMGRTGFIVNCLAGIGLLVLALTGAVLWWPGIRLWKRGFSISLRHTWKRINFDAHNAVGIWTLLIVSWWGLTAVYFLLPAKVSAVVNAVSPLVAMKPPVTPEPAASKDIVPLETIVAAAKKISPGYVSGVALPEKPGGKVTVYVDRRLNDFSHRDIDAFDGHTGKLLSTWHYGDNKSLGDWLVWLVYPLHFGTLWGLPVKIVWSMLGMSLPVLSVTGLLMYWNRYLGKRRHRSPVSS